MKNILVSLTAVLALAAANAWAKAPPDATGECKDGTYTTAAQKEGACSSHGGVKKWLAKEEKAKPEKASKSGEKAAKAEEKSSKSSDKAAKGADKAVAAAKPADATGECKDGSYTTSASKSGACAGHKGVKTWYGSEKEAEAKATGKGSSPTKPAATSAAAPAPAAASTSAPAKSGSSTTASERTAAAGGGAGKVWVNTDSKVYHCEKDALYGKTKQGEYMTEAQAKASGARAARGKECT